jgi:hypothetical protein
MNTTEIIGIGASLLVLISFLLKDVRKLRIVNSVGCIVFVVYGVLLGSVPVVFTNSAIILINLYYLLIATQPSSKE